MLLTVASTLGLHCLPTSKNWTRLIFVRKKLTFLPADCEDPNRIPLSAVYTLGLHYLSISKHWTLGLDSVGCASD